MSHPHARAFLAQCLQGMGMDAESSASAADSLIAFELAGGLLAQAALDHWERDAHIYHLRSQGLTSTVIGVRVTLARSKVFEAIRRHTKRRRAALKMAS